MKMQEVQLRLHLVLHQDPSQVSAEDLQQLLHECLTVLRPETGFEPFPLGSLSTHNLKFMDVRTSIEQARTAALQNNVAGAFQHIRTASSQLDVCLLSV
jgi:hypothetical protein